MSTKTARKNRFAAPAPPEPAIPRPGLARKLDEGLEGRVIKLTAPTGFGKTITVAMWLKEEARRSLWISLDRYDNTPSIFYKQLCAALASAHPGCASMEHALESATFGASPVEHTIEAFMGLPQEAAGGEKRVLVFDDAHVVTHPEIIKSLPYVLRRLPEYYVIVLTGRGDGVASGFEDSPEEGLMALDEDNLKFTPEEVRECFVVHEHKISTRDARRVYRGSGGWPIAVSTMAASNISLSGRKVRKGKVDGLSREQILTDCIREHFWEPCDMEARQFLLKTCILDELDPELCARLTGIGSAERVLKLIRRIAAESALIRQRGDGSYACHALFKDFLRARPDAECEELDVELTQIYDTAAKYYMETGGNYQAVDYAIKGGNMDTVTKVLEEILKYDARNNSVAEHIDKIKIHLLGKLDEETIDKYPYLRLIFTWYHHLTANAEAMYRSFDKLYGLLPKLKSASPDLLTTANWFIPLDHRYPLETLEERIYKPAKKSGGGKALRPFAPVVAKNLPYFHKGPVDFSGFPGMPEDTSRFETLFPAQNPDVIRVLSLALQAGIFFERNDLREALIKTRELVENLPAEVAPDIVFIAHMLLISVLDAMELHNESDMELEKLLSYLDESGALFLYPNLMAYRTKLRLANGDERAAAEWLENYFVDPEASLELHKIFQHFTTARSLMVCGTSEEARSFLHRLEDLTREFDRKIDHIEALMLLAILEWYRGKKPLAIRYIESALLLAQEYGYIRLFADEGEAVMPLVRAISARSDLSDAQGDIDSRYLRRIHIAATVRAKKHFGIASAMQVKRRKLSGQQRLMLEYQAKGYGNAEIAEETNLSINTIKVHTSLAYKKLGVTNSIDAVIRAYELGVFDEKPRDEGKVDRRLKVYASLKK